MSITTWSLPPSVRAVLREFPSLELTEGKRHPKARNVETQDWIPIPVSPSCRRCEQNLRAQLRRLAITGRGFIAAKKGS